MSVRVRHVTGRLRPYTVNIAVHLVQWSAELRQYVDVISQPARLIHSCGEVRQCFVTICHQFHEVAVVQTAQVISLDVLEAEYLGVSLVLVPVSLCMEVSVGRAGSVRAETVCTEEGDRSRSYRRIDHVWVSCSVVHLLCRCHVVVTQGALQVIEQVRRSAVIGATAL